MESSAALREVREKLHVSNELSCYIVEATHKLRINDP